MESQKPILGSKEATEQNFIADKTDSSDVYNPSQVANRLENRLGDGGAKEHVAESSESEVVRLSDMAHNLGGMALPGEVQDPRI
jgi:hypothetical protein